jgi:hypothetical protein
MIWESAISWATILLGLVLTVLAARAVFYFGRQIRIAGGSWILVAFQRTALTVTVACAWFTLARAIALSFGPQPLVSLVSGLVIVWLLLLPPMLQAEFRSHEGR